MSFSYAKVWKKPTMLVELNMEKMYGALGCDFVKNKILF
jgi:hypothetical protein